ncbi:MAG: site-specific integrase [Clostridiales bacterium]|nr:site-specific integrase [Clostridiales bacterium]
MPKAKYKIDKNLNLYYVNLDTGLRDNKDKIIYKKFRAKTTAELDRKVEEFYKEKSHGVIVDRKNVLVKDYCDIWLTSYKSACRVNTRNYYKSLVDVHIKPAIGNYKVFEVTAEQLQKLLNDMAKKDKSTKTIKGVRQVLRSVFETAVDNRLIAFNPGAKLRVIGGKPPKMPRALTEDEKKAIKNTMNTHSFGVFIAFSYYCGLRRGECAALTAEDIKNGFVRINKQHIFPNNNQPVLGPPKTEAGNRTIPIPKELQRIIDERLNLGLMHPNAYLFTYDGLRPLSHHVLTRAYKTFMTEALGENNDVNEHLLRHNYCSMLYYANVDLLTASRLMGHDDVETTLKIYTHLSDQQKVESYEKVAAIG